MGLKEGISGISKYITARLHRGRGRYDSFLTSVVSRMSRIMTESSPFSYFNFENTSRLFLSLILKKKATQKFSVGRSKLVRKLMYIAIHMIHISSTNTNDLHASLQDS